ncbi:DUF4871 domain-containing protein [Cohnella sp. WQ 127256]|uniref:DUF4871 domain-containing protein n=1 Tax=Cohnella sp. WQ 127256 TaxID=2938790 RepID=UPI0021174F1B|nr:DUF4871 domain-containing protein [Cohnella sp. WQ 127256]
MSKDSKPSWYDELSQTPFDRPQWSIEKTNKVLNTFSQSVRIRQRSRRTSYRISTAVLLTTLIVVTIMYDRSGIGNERSIVQHENPSKTAHNEYRSNGVVQWEVFPGGDQVAGKRAGARWMISKPIAELLDRKVRIVGIHEQTGLTIEELPEITINETNAQEYGMLRSTSGATFTQTQIVSDMAIPLAGKWTFQMFIDGSNNGEIVLDVPDGDWQLSPSFKSEMSQLTGIEEKLGFIGMGFIEAKRNKYLWHFWGTSEEVKGNLVIYAAKQSTDEFLRVFDGYLSPGKVNGADASIPSSMMLPTAGVWKLIVTINGRWFENVIVQVDKLL